MDLLVVARHGDYGKDGHLNPLGCAQVNRLANKLRPFVDLCSKTLILTSPSSRDYETAVILGHVFGVDFEEHKVLFSDKNHPEDLPGILELIESYQNKASTIIAVGHQEVVQRFPKFFAEIKWGSHLDSWSIEKGEAWLLDDRRKTLVHTGDPKAIIS